MMGPINLDIALLEPMIVGYEENSSTAAIVKSESGKGQNRLSSMMIKWSLSDTICANIPDKGSAKIFLMRQEKSL